MTGGRTNRKYQQHQHDDKLNDDENNDEDNDSDDEAVIHSKPNNRPGIDRTFVEEFIIIIII